MLQYQNETITMITNWCAVGLILWILILTFTDDRGGYS